MPTEKLTIVIPAFNEEETLQSSVQRLLEIEDQIAASTKSDTNFLANILIVDDGSSDQTWQKIEQLNRYSSRIEALSFSRNFGHQNALLAGLAEAVQSADMIVTIDADLQDDPTKIVDMVEMYRNGTDIVYGVRSNRSSDTWFKRFTANSYYRFRQLLGVNLIPNHADFRLMSKEAVNALLKYHEQNAFIRGLIPKLGYTSEKVYYKRAPRAVGETKYPLKKMLAFAWDGITSLSIAPVRLILVLGLIISLVATGMVGYTLTMNVLGQTIHGWSSLMISIWFLAGLQMISLGIIGEYIGKIMLDVKHRPHYHIQKKLK